MGLRKGIGRLPRLGFGARGLRREIDDEFEFHLAMIAHELESGGMPARMARESAEARFGNRAQYRQACYRLGRLRQRREVMHELVQDLRYAARMLRHAPGFAAVAVLTLALGIGANAAIFSVVNAVLLRPLPYPDAERLVWMWDTQVDLAEAPFSAPELVDYRAQNTSFENIAAMRGLNFQLTGRGEAERIRGELVTPEYLDVLGVKPILGRGFQKPDGVAGAPRVAILSYASWQGRFGGDPAIVGQSLMLNEQSVSIIGVLPETYRRDAQTELLLNPRKVMPEVFPNFTGDPLEQRGMHYLNAIARLKPGVSLESAQAELSGIATRLGTDESGHHGVKLIPLHEYISGGARPALIVLLVAVGLVLLIACSNLANLLLARASGRHREIAVRAALGAGRGRIARQLLTESLLLGLVGGALGLIVAQLGIQLLVTMGGEQLPRAGEIRLDTTVLAFSLVLSVLTGVLFGLAPAMSVSRTSPSEALKEGGRTGSAGPWRSRLRRSLVAAEVALSLVLLVGAGLLLRSMVSLLSVDPGFVPERLVTMWISFSSSKYGETSKVERFLEELVPRLRAIPGVEGVALSNDLPFEGQDTTGYPVIEGRPPANGQEEPVVVGQHVISAGYFATMGGRLLQGREFNEHDTATSTPVVIINDSMAKRFWPDGDALGKRFRLFGGREGAPREIVGVVADIRHNGLGSPRTPDAYAPVVQDTWSYTSITLRTGIEEAAVVPLVRREVVAMDPDLPVFAVRSMNEVLADTMRARRATLLLTGLFASLALALAAVGIYGVMAYAVSQRLHEIGVRMALGAQRSTIFRLIVGQGMRTTGTGMAIGLVGALVLTRFLRSLLFGVEPADPVTLVIVTFTLAVVAFLACYLPARRAMRVDPSTALRYE